MYFDTNSICRSNSVHGVCDFESVLRVRVRVGLKLRSTLRLLLIQIDSNCRSEMY